MLASVEAWEGLAKVMCPLWGIGRGLALLGRVLAHCHSVLGLAATHWLSPVWVSPLAPHLGFSPPASGTSMGPELTGQTKVLKLAPLSSADRSHRAELVALSSSFCFVLLLFFSLLFFFLF